MPDGRRRIRDPKRKQKILESAVELIARNGYNAVNLADIGAAAGIVGSGIYRHFDGKAAILVELFDQVIDRLIANADAVLAARLEPEHQIAALVRGHVELTISERPLLRIYVQESRSLPAADLARLRSKQRHYLEQWVGALVMARPDMAAEEAHLVVHACIGSIHSILTYRPSLTESELDRHLQTIAMGVVGLPLAGDATVPVAPAVG